MYRNLSPQALGISCGQSELIELSLTHGFGGFDFDLQDFQTQVESKGLAAAGRFLRSAKIKLNAGPLPLELSSVDGRFESELDLAKPLLESAKSLGVTSVQATLEASNPSRPYHENFDFHRQRLARYAATLAEFDLGLSLSFLAPEPHRKLMPQPFISKPDEMLMLLQLIGHENVRVVVDLWHWAVAGASLDLLSTITADQISEVRVADLPAGLLPSEAADEQRALPGTSDQVPCVEALTRLAKMDYQGALTLAPHVSQLPNQRREAAVLAAVETLDGLMQAAGLDKRGRIATSVDEEEATASNS